LIIILVLIIITVIVITIRVKLWMIPIITVSVILIIRSRLSYGVSNIINSVQQWVHKISETSSKNLFAILIF